MRYLVEFLSHFLRLVVVMLFSALSANMAFSVPMNTSEISFFQAENTLLDQSQDVAFAARAPPLAVANVAFTGGVTSMQGGAFPLHGQETVAALFGFERSTNAPNRTATQADVAGYFQQNRQFWTQDPIQFSGNRVFQRNDLIDPNHISEWTVRGQTVRGTNIERMAAGRAPIGTDGNSVNLHHLTQQQNGAIAEVTQTLHSTNHGVLHMPNTVPSGINRAQFQTWSRNYWKQRAANWGK